MWIVRLALRRPYTFVVLSLMLFILAPVVISRTPTDIFPNIDIPVVSVVWQYSGLSAEELSERIVYINERSLTTTVNNIEHIESQSMEGIAVIKVFFQPHANLPSAIAQTTAICQTQLKQLPAGTTPPLIITYNASTVPILMLGLSGLGLSEQQLNDLGQNFIRPALVTVPGTAIPNSFGGKQREVMVDLNTQALQAKRLSPADVVNAIGNQNLILPGGTSKIGSLEYDVEIKGSPQRVDELNDLPIRTLDGATIYVRDVAHVRDGYPPQTNIVRSDGLRGSMMAIYKNGDVSTLDIISGVRRMLPIIAATLPPQLKITPIADQSVFVRASISAVVREAVIAACLTAIMILVFLGSWRSTLIIAISIPLSILCSIFALSALGETINIMTLGGLALTVGILVDDATVEIENINRNFEMGKEIEQAILDGAAQIAVPAFVSTLSICIVFVPMFFLTGVARYLFVPLAEAVSFAMLASYLLSRTIVPTLAKYLLKGHSHHEAVAHADRRNPFVRAQLHFENGFEHLRGGYRGVLEKCIRHRAVFVACFLLACIASFALAPWLGRDFFPASDSGQFRL
ncbi:MAG: efflux RND transporter permease subunit, partial [Acidobacteriaceae bacterium]|nr:efflux RND transporter permease subunit [Acidobacteriaceae bacterium]